MRHLGDWSLLESNKRIVGGCGSTSLKSAARVEQKKNRVQAQSPPNRRMTYPQTTHAITHLYRFKDGCPNANSWHSAIICKCHQTTMCEVFPEKNSLLTHTS